MSQQLILAFLGKKQAGKNTACNFMAGVELLNSGVLENFAINTKGELVTKDYIPELGMQEEEEIVIPTDQMHYADIVNVFSFARPLKEICIQLLGLDRDLVYGTDQDKSQLSGLSWEDMPGYDYTPGEHREMTIREVLQFVGTEIFRKIKPNCWTDTLINQIKEINVPISLICDCRFQNEVEAVKNAGGYVIKLTKGLTGDGHASEKDIENIDPKLIDFILDNKDMNIPQQNQALAEALVELGVWQKNQFVENN